MLAVLVVVTTTGLSDGDARALEDKLQAEVRAQGVEVARSGIDAGCMDDPSCVKGALEISNARALVSLDATRAGSFVQLSLRSVDLDGNTLAQVDRSTRLDALRKERLLPDGAVPRPPPEPVKPPPDPAPPVRAQPLATEVPHETAAPSSDARSPLDSPRTLGALAAIGAGSAVVVLGVVASAVELSVIKDPASLGVDKERAATLVPVMGVLALAGAGAVVFGAALIALE